MNDTLFYGRLQNKLTKIEMFSHDKLFLELCVLNIISGKRSVFVNLGIKSKTSSIAAP